jgi:hypothetical protein
MTTVVDPSLIRECQCHDYSLRVYVILRCTRFVLNQNLAYPLHYLNNSIW